MLINGLQYHIITISMLESAYPPLHITNILNAIFMTEFLIIRKHYSRSFFQRYCIKIDNMFEPIAMAFTCLMLPIYCCFLYYRIFPVIQYVLECNIYSRQLVLKKSLLFNSLGNMICLKVRI